MITLVTGGPGTGKTAWLLDQLLDLRKNEPDKLLYIHGVRNLRGLPHTQIFCRSQLCDICRSQDQDLKKSDHVFYVEDWPEWKQSGALIVIDEVQRIWRPRSGGAQPHASVSTLETHRHYGLDFWLISQGPHLFDNFIRLLVGRHVHLVSKWSGRTQYEWPECKQDVQSRVDAVTRPYSLPKRVYSMYDSAEVHTKQDKRRPFSLYVAVVAVLLVVFLSIFVVKRMQKRLNPQPVIEQAEIGVGGALAAPTPGSVDSSFQGKNKAFPDFKPTIEGLPESAPAYSDLIKVTAAPILAGCVYSIAKEACSCYTSQATPYPTSKQYCMEVVNNHRFNPYLAANREKEKEVTTTKIN